MATRSTKKVRTLPRSEWLEGLATGIFLAGLVLMSAVFLANTELTITIMQAVLSMDGTPPVVNTAYPQFDLVLLLLSIAISHALFGVLCVIILGPLIIRSRRNEAQFLKQLESDRTSLPTAE